MDFKLVAPYTPTGDQPQAIEELTKGIKDNRKHQVLLGVTGSGKTYTMANVIANLNRPTLIMSHNKTLAAQLYQEFRDFFPHNAVSYFVSYYDYYQPEAYIPRTDTYIEKETEINEEIDKLRLAATMQLLTRRDTIIVASVSCIYNIGSPREYGNFTLDLRKGLSVGRESIMTRLTELQYERATYGFHRGSFRVRGETIDIFPAYQDIALRVEHDGKKITALTTLDPTNGSVIDTLNGTVIYPAKHYMTDPRNYKEVFAVIREDLRKQIVRFKKEGKELEAHRIEKKVNFDLEMIEEIGYVNGIENYSRYFDGRKPGDPPYSLLDYYNQPYGDDWLLFVDESHMTIPQVRGMYNGDQARKQTLVDYGFRLPSAMDNRPLKFDEFMRRIPQTIHVSATPAPWEISMATETNGLQAADYNSTMLKDAEDSSQSVRIGIVEQLIRPTGLVDPDVEIRPSEGQIADLVKEILKRKEKGQRTLVTTLTKRMAEDLTDALKDPAYIAKLLKTPLNTLDKDIFPTANYLHSDVTTLDRSDILDDLRRGTYDVLVGINLLREGLDLPEVALVAILDADKEGFLRSTTSLVQTMGRAARHEEGHVIMYADRMTGSMEQAIEEIRRRRKIQIAHNTKHGITPTSIKKKIREKLVEREIEDPGKEERSLREYIQVGTTQDEINQLLPDEKKKMIGKLKKAMKEAASEMNFEMAAKIRDQIKALQ